MSFIDELKIYVKAGKGGDGVVRWLRKKGLPFGGPSGGNGGNGGSVYFRGSRDTNLLFKYRFVKEFDAENGTDGGKDSLFGKNGEDLYIDIPIGSLITNTDSGEEYEILKEGEVIQVLKGGEGGNGNENYKSSRDQAPERATPGEKGEQANFHVEIKLIADVGLIGIPSAGKTSLLNALTKADAKVGDYPFTTLDPNLGVLYGNIIADLPGIIEGAAEGKGLGHKFLKHIQRTGLLLHCVSVEYEKPLEIYETIRKELKKYDKNLSKKKEIILLTKTDLLNKEEIKEKVKTMSSLSKDILTVSIHDEDSLKKLSDYISQEVSSN